jgi:hypothetical protein
MEWNNKFEIGEQVWVVWHGRVHADIVERVIMDLTPLGHICFKYKLIRKMGEYAERDLFRTEDEAQKSV